jgi:predicted transcriptional regulator
MRQLGQLEAAIMQRLWDTDAPLSVREVLDDLNRERPLAYTTVMTVLDNLHGKGMVSREKDGRAYRYRPASTREEHTADLLQEVLGGAGDPEAALLHFVGKLSATQVDELRTALDQVEDDA